MHFLLKIGVRFPDLVEYFSHHNFYLFDIFLLIPIFINDILIKKFLKGFLRNKINTTQYAFAIIKVGTFISASFLKDFYC